jgi:hypothetical protein
MRGLSTFLCSPWSLSTLSVCHERFVYFIKFVMRGLLIYFVCHESRGCFLMFSMRCLTSIMFDMRSLTALSCLPWELWLLFQVCHDRVNFFHVCHERLTFFIMFAIRGLPIWSNLPWEVCRLTSVFFLYFEKFGHLSYLGMHVHFNIMAEVGFTSLTY